MGEGHKDFVPYLGGSGKLSGETWVRGGGEGGGRKILLTQK